MVPAPFRARDRIAAFGLSGFPLVHSWRGFRFHGHAFIEAVRRGNGFQPPVICTPEELVAQEAT